MCSWVRGLVEPLSKVMAYVSHFKILNYHTVQKESWQGQQKQKSARTLKKNFKKKLFFSKKLKQDCFLIFLFFLWTTVKYSFSYYEAKWWCSPVISRQACLSAFPLERRNNEKLYASFHSLSLWGKTIICKGEEEQWAIF